MAYTIKQCFSVIYIEQRHIDIKHILLAAIQRKSTNIEQSKYPYIEHALQ